MATVFNSVYIVVSRGWDKLQVGSASGSLGSQCVVWEYCNLILNTFIDTVQNQREEPVGKKSVVCLNNGQWPTPGIWQHLLHLMDSSGSVDIKKHLYLRPVWYISGPVRALPFWSNLTNVIHCIITLLSFRRVHSCSVLSKKQASFSWQHRWRTKF